MSGALDRAPNRCSAAEASEPLPGRSLGRARSHRLGAPGPKPRSPPRAVELRSHRPCRGPAAEAAEATRRRRGARASGRLAPRSVAEAAEASRSDRGACPRADPLGRPAPKHGSRRDPTVERCPRADPLGSPRRSTESSRADRRAMPSDHPAPSHAEAWKRCVAIVERCPRIDGSHITRHAVTVSERPAPHPARAAGRSPRVAPGGDVERVPAAEPFGARGQGPDRVADTNASACSRRPRGVPGAHRAPRAPSRKLRLAMSTAAAAHPRTEVRARRASTGDEAPTRSSCS